MSNPENCIYSFSRNRQDAASRPARPCRQSIAGQIKALSMIVAIEGFITGRPSPSQTQPTASPVQAEIHAAEWLSKQQQAGDPGDAVAPPEAQAAVNQVPEPKPTPPVAWNPSLANPFVTPEGKMRVPDAPGNILDVALDTANSLRLPFSIQKGRFGKRR